ncbi:MAG TPA: ferredoxin, partial [Casimicrobiaceae bacterium]
GTMKKCTLCVERIYDTALPVAEREPACVLACSTHARHFGDFDDPQSKVSKLTAERNGFGLLGELDYKPVNRYLPPRTPPAPPAPAPELAQGGALSRLVARARAALA